MRLFLSAGVFCSLASRAAAADDYDPCTCLKWKDLYAPVPAVGRFPTTWPRLMCGEALELMGQADMLPLENLYYGPLWMGFQYHEFCASFYHKMDNNYCVNTGMDEYGATPGYTWCVVSDECKKLNGGRPVSNKQTFYHGPDALSFMKIFSWWRNLMDSLTTKQVVKRDVAYKICTKGEDKRLRDLEPLEVMELAKSMDSVVGYVTKMAFLRLMPSGPEGKPGGYDWAHVQDLVARGDVSSMPKPLQEAIAADEPIVIDVDPNGHTHQRIVHGKKVYYLDNMCSAAGCGGAQWPFRRVKDMGEGEL
eukprot:CAMPEP_0171099936 /NCGR_PEP_ID=MMETSP0766_2-20121228/52657_1 /TAXON_ID=439317 /ORGANISM="Gambierdiscus australes, Strain CAWD 149" /LENGTH=305 /DNA_ID=CAMNT_0011559671 /DNA_START=36 /DNA_END=953 /DNA_ORIENTATION=+